MSCVWITRPQSAATLDAPPSAQPDTSKNFGERAWRLLNERAAAAVSTKDNCMVVVKNIPAESEPLPHPENFVDVAFYINLNATLEVMFVSGWGVFIQQYQFN